MKKLLLIVGIVSIVFCVLFLLFAMLHLSGYFQVYDGTAELYRRIHHRMIVFFVIGIVLAVIGTACIIIRLKI